MDVSLNISLSDVCKVAVAYLIGIEGDVVEPHDRSFKKLNLQKIFMYCRFEDQNVVNSYYQKIFSAVLHSSPE